MLPLHEQLDLERSRPWRFQPLRIDPIFSWLAHPSSSPLSARFPLLRRPKNGVQVSLYSLVIILVAWLGAALLQGHLASKGAGVNVTPALRSFVDSLPTVTSPHPRSTVPKFPLIDDINSWTLVIASIATFGLLFRQWKIMGGVIPDLVESGALKVTEPTQFAHLLKRINKLMASIWLNVVLGAIALVIAYLICRSLEHDGIYEVLSKRGASSKRWTGEAYSSWWAAARPGSVGGLVVFGLLLAIYLYYLLAQYAAGIMWVILTILGGKHAHFRFDLENEDGYFGWRPLRDLMFTVYWSALVQVLALLSLLHLLTTRSYIFLSPVLALFFVLNPVYIATPFVIVSPSLREERSRLGKRVARSNNVPASNIKAELDHQARQANTHEFIRSMLAFPIRWREFTFAVVTYGIPLGALIFHI